MATTQRTALGGFADDENEEVRDDPAKYPDNPEGEPYSLPGAVTHKGCTVASGIPPHVELPLGGAYLVWSTSADDSGHPNGADLQALFEPLGENGLIKHTVSTALPYKQYYAMLSKSYPLLSPADWFGDPIRFKTNADSSVATTMTYKLVYGSCQRWHAGAKGPVDENGKPLQTAWHDVIKFAPDHMFDTGDFHYRGKGGNAWGAHTDWVTWAKMYWQQLRGLDVMRKARALVVEDQVSDDHEFSQNNGQSYYPKGSGDTYPQGVARHYQAIATRKVFAMYHLADEHAAEGLYGSYMKTPNVRVVILDDESRYRAYREETHSAPGKGSFLGDKQTKWLWSLLTDDPVTLNVLVAGKSWLGDGIKEGEHLSGEDTDKVWAYPDWRHKLATDIEKWNSTPGNQPINIVWLGGDRHCVAYVCGEHNQWGHFPCYVGSGWSQHPLLPRRGEEYDAAYPWDSPVPPQDGNVMQYLQGELVDDPGSKTVTLTFRLRYLKPEAGKEIYELKMETWKEFSDSWPYLSTEDDQD